MTLWIHILICKTPSSDEDSDVECFSEFNAKEKYSDFVKTLSRGPSESTCYNDDGYIFGLTTIASGKESGLLFGLNEKTIRLWRKDFYKNKGYFTESKKGKHSHPLLLEDEECRRKAS